MVPVLCTFLVRGPFVPEARNWVMRRLLGIYAPALDWALAHRRTVLGSAAGLLALALTLAFGLPRPLARTLDAWNWHRAARLAGASPGCSSAAETPSSQVGALRHVRATLSGRSESDGRLRPRL